MRPLPATYDPATHRRRLKRYDLRGDARLLTCSCFQRRKFLNSDRTRGWLIEALAHAREVHGFRLWAWVIMPEHVHVLLWPRRHHDRVGPILTTLKQSVAKRTLAWVRANAPGFLPRMADTDPRGRTVHRFWQRGGGYDQNLWTPERIWFAIGYIHLNPVRRGLCSRPIDWPWSSAAEFVRPGSGPLSLDRESLPATS